MTENTLADDPVESSNVMLEPLLKIEEVARMLGRTHWTIRHDIKAGKLRSVRLGRRIMIEQSEIRRLIEEGRTWKLKWPGRPTHSHGTAEG